MVDSKGGSGGRSHDRGRNRCWRGRGVHVMHCSCSVVATTSLTTHSLVILRTNCTFHVYSFCCSLVVHGLQKLAVRQRVISSKEGLEIPRYRTWGGGWSCIWQYGGTLNETEEGCGYKDVSNGENRKSRRAYDRRDIYDSLLDSNRKAGIVNSIFPLFYARARRDGGWKTLPHPTSLSTVGGLPTEYY